MYNSLQYSHQLIRAKVQPGDLVVDATAGNGHDTLLLAQLVGEKGLVYSYDIQESALNQTRLRLVKEGLDKRVKLIQRGHETLSQDLSSEKKVKAVMFNLGYLPGGDHSIITRPKTTIHGIETALLHLLPRGIVTIVAYYGHPGGEEELVSLTDYLASLDQKVFSVLRYQYINQDNQPPILFAIEKKN